MYRYHIKELGIHLHFTQDDVDRFHDWVENVVDPWMMKNWGYAGPDFIGGRFVWELGPTGIGTTIRVRTAFAGIKDNPELEIVGVDVF